MSSTQQIVVGVDGSDSSLDAVDYVGRIISDRSGFLLHLAYVVGPQPPELLEFPGATQTRNQNRQSKKQVGEWAHWLEEARVKAEPVLERSKNVLAGVGVSMGAVRTKLLECRSGDDIARSLVEFTIGRGADTLAVGWGAYSRLAEIFHRHVGEEIVGADERLTTWVIRVAAKRKVDAPQRILLGVDETEASVRAVDYVGGLLAGSTTVRLRLFQALMPVKPESVDYIGISATSESTDAELEEAERRRLERANKDAEHLFERARSTLVDAGVDASVIESRCTDGFLLKEAVPDAILSAARECGCDTLVVGRSTLPWFRELFRRHVGAELAARSKKFTVWSVE